MAKLHGSEVAKHNTRESCWVIIHGKVYDVTEFLPEHPGGEAVILKYAGKDATEAYDPIHPPDIIDEHLPPQKRLGEVDMSTVIVEDQPGQDHEEEARLERIKKKPDVSECFNLLDFEAVARQVMKKTAWAYYSSGADDEITLRENHHAFQRIWFRPRILTNVGNVDYSTTMLGAKVSMPIYITATALGKLGHPDGETVLTRAARTHNIIQMIPTLASCSFDEIRNAAEEGQVQWMQLYVNKDREITKRYVQHGEKRGIRGLFITVDAPQLGRREKDMRSKYNESAAKVQTNETKLDRSQGAARAISSFIDPSLCWDDIEWFRSITKMPIILKGVQRHEDALKAVEYGLQGVVLSNHGGRQLDFARSGIEILVEVMDALKKKGWEKKLEVYVDGGVRRGTDIIKAVCLGARGVGIGRPFLYAMSAYGQPGVEKAIQRFVLSNPNLMVVLKDEMEMNMRLIGARTLDELDQSFVDTRALSTHIVPVPSDSLALAVYDPLVIPKAKL